MLYDHRSNKIENRNVAEKEEFGKIVLELSNILHSKFKENIQGE